MMKQMEFTKKKIGENTFYIKPFPAFPAAYISAELSRVLAPAVGELGPVLKGEVGEKFDIMDIDVEDALPALSGALGSISGEKMESLMKLLLIRHKNISVKGPATDNEPAVLDEDLADEVFCGELQDMLILCFEVVKVNYAGFFKKIAGRFGGPKGSTETGETQESTEA